jgi:phage gpG-like protein
MKAEVKAKLELGALTNLSKPALNYEMGQMVIGLLKKRLRNEQVDIEGNTLWAPHVDSQGQAYQGIKFRKYPRPGKTGLNDYRGHTYKPLTKGNTKILIDKGHMINAMKVTEVSEHSITIEVDTPYAEYHQDGTAYIPARPFLPKDGEEAPQWMEDQIGKFIEGYLDDTIKNSM